MAVIRDKFPRVRSYKKAGRVYYYVDCRRKGWTGQKRIGAAGRSDALKKAEEIAAKVAAEGLVGANAFSKFASNLELESWTKQLAVHGRTLADAVGHYLDWLEEQARQQTVPFLRDLLPKWSESKQSNKMKPLRPRTLADNRAFTRQLIDDWGTYRLNEVSKLAVEEFLNGMKRTDGSSASSQARKDYLSHLKNFFNWTIDQGHLAENPINRLKVHVLDKIPETFSIVQCREILRLVQQPDHRPLMGYVALCLFAGIRPNEAQRLSWSNVAGNVVLIEPEKSKVKETRQVDVSLHPSLAIWMAAVDSKQPLIPANFPRRLDRFIKALVFPWVQDGMRHTFATFWLRIEKNRAHLAEIMGTSPFVIGKHYVRPVDANDAAEFWKLIPE